MRYKCQTVPVTKLIPTNKGFLCGLCDSCQTLDCENDVGFTRISILGINVERKLLSKKDGFYLVISCEGYLNNAKSDNK